MIGKYVCMEDGNPVECTLDKVPASGSENHDNVPAGWAGSYAFNGYVIYVLATNGFHMYRFRREEVSCTDM